MLKWTCQSVLGHLWVIYSESEEREEDEQKEEEGEKRKKQYKAKVHHFVLCERDGLTSVDSRSGL